MRSVTLTDLPTNTTQKPATLQCPTFTMQITSVFKSVLHVSSRSHIMQRSIQVVDRVGSPVTCSSTDQTPEPCWSQGRLHRLIEHSTRCSETPWNAYPSCQNAADIQPPRIPPHRGEREGGKELPGGSPLHGGCWVALTVGSGVRGQI